MLSIVSLGVLLILLGFFKCLDLLLLLIRCWISFLIVFLGISVTVSLSPVRTVSLDEHRVVLTLPSPDFTLQLFCVFFFFSIDLFIHFLRGSALANSLGPLSEVILVLFSSKLALKDNLK